MGSNDIPPPRVPSFFLPVSNALLQAGGSLWTLCYILLTLQSFKDHTYGMPLFALAFNFAWEIIYALFVAESRLEQIVFSIWLLIDLGLVYGLLTFGKEEWNHSPLVKKHLGKIFWGLVLWCCLAHWTFAKWWIENEVGKKEGKFYGGVVAGDTTELGFWSAVVCQVYLSVASLGQLFIRRHTGGVSWGIWATRALGTVLGLHGQYAWAWYYWREGHEYFMNPFAILLWGTALVSDLMYPFVFGYFRRSEKVGLDGRKFAADVVAVKEKKTR